MPMLAMSRCAPQIDQLLIAATDFHGDQLEVSRGGVLDHGSLL
jgi:hypothetical protein